MRNFKYKTIFASQLKPIISNDIDSYLSLASQSNLNKFLPKGIDFNKKIDFLGIAGEAFIANRLNGNDDAVSTKEAIQIADLFPFSFIDAEHSREKIIGVVLTASFTEFGGNKILTKEEIQNYTKPFSVTIGGIIWKVINPDLTEYIEKSGDPSSESFGSIYISWELAFDESNLIIIDANKKNLEDGEIVKDPSQIKSLENKLKAFGGSGFIENGKKIGRIPIGDVIPLGIGLTNTPAAQVKPIKIEEDSVNIKLSNEDSKAKQEIKEHADHFINKCSCGKTLNSCGCQGNEDKTKINVIKRGCFECQQNSEGDFKGYTNESKEAYSEVVDKAKELQNTSLYESDRETVKNQIKSAVNPTDGGNEIPVDEKSKHLLNVNPDYKFGVCPECGHHSDYNSFIKSWNGKQTARCESCGKLSFMKNWLFLKKEDKTANNALKDKNQKILSHLKNVNVKKNGIFMKINNIKELTDEVLKECKASDIQEILESELKKISDKYVQEKQEKDNLVSNTNEKLASAAAELENFKKSNEDLAKKVNELISTNVAKEKQEVFSARMQTLDDSFQLSDKEREILASKIQTLDKDEEFTKFLEEAEILLAAKKKFKNNKNDQNGKDGKGGDGDDDDDNDSGKDDGEPNGKKNMKASSQDAVDETLNNAKKDEKVIPNSTAAEPTLNEKAKSAFGIEGWTVENKRKNRF